MIRAIMDLIQGPVLMNTKSIPQWVWVVPAILLVIAVARLPYGYYTFILHAIGTIIYPGTS